MDNLSLVLILEYLKSRPQLKVEYKSWGITYSWYEYWDEHDDIKIEVALSETEPLTVWFKPPRGAGFRSYKVNSYEELHNKIAKFLYEFREEEDF